MGERKGRWIYPKAQNKIAWAILGVIIKALTSQDFHCFCCFCWKVAHNFPSFCFIIKTWCSCQISRTWASNIFYLSDWKKKKQKQYFTNFFPSAPCRSCLLTCCQETCQERKGRLPSVLAGLLCIAVSFLANAAWLLLGYKLGPWAVPGSSPSSSGLARNLCTVMPCVGESYCDTETKGHTEMLWR